MLTPLRILIIEDYADDALILLREVRLGGYAPTYLRVQTEEELRLALAHGEWDVILSDYRLPGFSGLDALRMVQTMGLDVPFILISGMMGEDLAVEAMRAGCHDYLTKKHLARLVPALERELREVEVRRARRDAEAARRAAESALRASEARYRILVERLPAVVYTAELDEAYSTTYVSPQVEALTGYAAEAYAANPALWHECLHPEDRDRVLAALRCCLRTGAPLLIEYRIVRPDGREVWVRDEASIIRDAEGKPLHLQGVLVDVSRTREAEEALHQRIEYLETLYQAAETLQETLDTRAILDRVCHLAVDCFGLRLAWVGLSPTPGTVGRLRPSSVAGDPSLADYVGNLSFALTDEEEHPVVRAMRSGNVVSVPDIATDPTFHPAWRPDALARGLCALVVLPLMRSENVLGVLVAYGHRSGQFGSEAVRTMEALANLSAAGLERAQLYGAVQQHAETLEEQVRLRTGELRESEARFRAVLEHSAIGVALTDPQGRILMSNPALERLLGRRGASLLGERIQEAFDLCDAEGQALSGAAAAPVGRRESTYRRSDGSRGTVELVVSAIRREGEPSSYHVWLVDDVTEARSAQAALVQAEKLAVVGRLAAAFVHEIKNPLQSVIGCLGLAREMLPEGDGPQASEPRRYLDVANEELLRANNLLSEMRNLSRQGQPLERTPSDVNALLRRVAMLTAKRARDRGVDMRLELDEELPPLLLAPDSIHQVFLNGVLNALDAMPEGGLLRLSTERVSGGVCIRVADTGVGIAPEVLPLMFESFFTTKEEGLGLGLFVSQSIVSQHGGTIEVESTLGVGTTLRIVLPA
jgi:PAS domain S-box-containing protein